MTSFFLRKGVWIAVGILSAAIMFANSPQRVHADITLGESNGYGIQVDLEIAGLLSADVLNLTPGQLSMGSAPAPYADSATLFPLNANIGTTVGPIAGTSVTLDLAAVDAIINSYANSNVNGGPGDKFADGFGEVNGLDLGIGNADVSLPIGGFSSDLINITADTINSTSMVDGDFGALNASGTSIIENLVIEVQGTELDLASLLGANGSIDANGFLTADPNTQLLSIGGVAGLDLTLNQQTLTGDGTNSLGIEVNALVLTLNGVDLGLPLINEAIDGGVYIGHSQASLSASIPEPSSFMTLCSGLLLFVRKRRNRKTY